MILRAAPAFLLLLTACSAPADAPADKDAPLDGVRVALPADAGAAAPAPHPSDELPGWTAAADGLSARLGYAGEAAELILECRAGTLAVTRNVPAPVGASALFALQGSKLILRLPVDATAVSGQRGYVWQGTIAATDPRLALLSGEFAGTLPGGGHIDGPASEVPATLIKRCAGG